MATATLDPAPAGAAWLRRQLDYGWVTILVGAAAMAATYPGRTHGLGMVTEPLLADLGLADPDGRVFYAALNLWGTLLGALFCLPVGWLLDWYGPRRVLAANLVLLGAAVWWMSGVRSWEALLAALVLTRGLGQSALSVVSITVVAKAFPAARLGPAMAWYSVLMGQFTLVLIRAVRWALGDGGADWRAVWAAVGVALVGLAATAALLARPPAPGAPGREPEGGATLGQALATPAFWAFALTVALYGMIAAGVALFNEDVFRERGFSRDLYLDVLSLATVVAVASKFLFGWLTRFVPLPKLLGAALAVTALALAGLPRATAAWHVYLYGAAVGVASGAVALVFFSTWGRLYGRRALGRIQGAAQALTVVASAAGPLVFAAGRRWAGGYAEVFFALAAAVAVMAVAVWFVPVPAFTPEEDAR